MPTIVYQDVADYREHTTASAWPPVTLICGEELLCQKALDQVLGALLVEADRTMGLERYDGGEESMSAVLASLNTFAMLSPVKVVLLHDARLFYSAKARKGLSERMIQAARGGEMKKASRTLLSLLALNGMRLADLAEPDQRRKLVDDVDGEPPVWFVQLVDYCREQGLTVPARQDDGSLLGDAMGKGFPDGHRLIITTDVVDRRKALFKLIDATGLVVDCTVPQGASRADRNAQDAAMQGAIDDVLATSGMRMAGDARRRLIEQTGFDLRTLVGNLEKLVSYVGDRKTIGLADVTALLSRSRKDPVFAFTNALADRNLTAALACMQHLLDDGMHPLQLLAAAANQVRRLLLAKDFILRDGGRTWSERMAFPGFKAAPFKAVQADDSELAALLERWDTFGRSAGGSSKTPKTSVSDLALARNVKSPFPIFQTLKKADAFSMEELASAMADLSDADWRIKTTGRDPRLLLEAALIGICLGKSDGVAFDRHPGR